MPDSPTAFAPAGTQELLRSLQRDEEAQLRLTGLTRDVARSFLGERSLLDKGPILEIFASLAYYGLTFGRGSQTLGEEYVDVLPVTGSGSRSSVASSRRRRLAILFTILLPHGVPYLFRYLRSLSVFADSSDVNAPPGADHCRPSKLRHALTASLRAILDTLIDSAALGHLASDLGLALFFLRGGPLEWGKRFVGIRYISTLPPPEAGEERSSPRYRLLGVLLLFPILRRIFALIRPSLSALRPDGSFEPHASDKLPAPTLVPFTLPSGPLPIKPDATSDLALPFDPLPASAGELERDARKCTLCLETWAVPTVTECGHVFCWSCIVGWSAEKEECPLCRQELNPSRLQPVYNL